jgi:thioredoxin reductase
MFINCLIKVSRRNRSFIPRLIPRPQIYSLPLRLGLILNKAFASFDSTQSTMPKQRTPLVHFDDIPGSLPSSQVPENANLDKIAHAAIFKLNHLQPDSLAANAIWRDLLSLTGSYRTFHSAARVYPIFTKLSEQKKRSIFRLYEGHAPRIGRGGKYCSWVDVDVLFSAEHANLSQSCRGIVSMAFDAESGESKVWMLRTWLECFDGLGHPDILSTVSDQQNGVVNGLANGKGGDSPPVENEYSVIIVGGGQAGLSLAGRLNALGVKYLVLERHPNIGDQWRGRYESLRWHTSREYGSLPFDHTFHSEPDYMVPTKRIGDGHQAWSERYGVHARTNTAVESAHWDESSKLWTVKTSSPDGDSILQGRNLVLAIGPGHGTPVYPPWASADKAKESGFRGSILHAFDGYHSAHAWAGKKGIVIGTANTAHDVAEDMANANMTTTMVQRNPTFIFPAEWLHAAEDVHYNDKMLSCEADRESFTYPNKVMREIINRAVWGLIKANPDRFDALEAAGFKLDRWGDIYNNLYVRFGGHYVDIGCSARIAKGEIKVKTETAVDLVENGLKFEDGSVVEADLIVLCTGFDKDFRNDAARILGPDIADQMDDFWGTDSEGELRALAKPAGCKCGNIWVRRYER